MVRGTAMTMETLTIISRESEFLWKCLQVWQRGHRLQLRLRDHRAGTRGQDLQ